MPQSPSDAELVSQACRGSKRDFESLVDRHLPTLIGFLRYLGVPDAQVEDLAQETFIKVLRSLSQYRPEKPFITWLTTIGRHVYIDDWRKTPKTRFLEIDGNYPEIPSDEQTEKQEMVRNLLDRLPEDAKFLLEMRFFQDLSFAEISEITGDPEGALRVRLYRIMQRLRAFGREAT
ncbi:MAG: sigma-70 family RNA polymerase sigma factor [Candidatus Riflebacteria bacterium]|nr:sigma-70 family RNA polymerase sigma factor [Candidatus Riflebacteria bacterium]